MSDEHSSSHEQVEATAISDRDRDRARAKPWWIAFALTQIFTFAMVIWRHHQ